MGRLPSDDREDGPGVLGHLDDLESVIRERGVHRVVLAPSELDSDGMLDMIRR